MKEEELEEKDYSTNLESTVASVKKVHCTKYPLKHTGHS